MVRPGGDGPVVRRDRDRWRPFMAHSGCKSSATSPSTPATPTCCDGRFLQVGRRVPHRPARGPDTERRLCVRRSARTLRFPRCAIETRRSTERRLAELTAGAPIAASPVRDRQRRPCALTGHHRPLRPASTSGLFAVVIAVHLDNIPEPQGSRRQVWRRSGRRVIRCVHRSDGVAVASMSLSCRQRLPYISQPEATI